MRTLACVLVLVAVAGIRTVPYGIRVPDAAEHPLPTRAIGYYDTQLRRVVLVGGVTELHAGMRDRVWSWSGTRWDPVSDSGPPSRGNAGIAYDARRNVAVLAGGAARTANDSSYEVVAESWQSSPTGWRRIDASDVTARDHNAMVYDAGRGSVLLFGGIPADRGAPWPTETWKLGARGWSRIATSGPEGRGRSAMVYDGARRQVVLFGGVGGAPSRDQPQPWFGDTWVFDRNGWRKVADSGPRARYAHGMVFDETRGVVLMYSGAAAHRDAPLSDMWQWDGRRWTEISLRGPTPGHRYSPVMVYDRARAKTVLYGGDPAKTDTWEWDGEHWTEIVASPT